MKKGQATYIAPLQPSTLATFRSWGISTGAGRIRLAQDAKVGSFWICTRRKSGKGKKRSCFAKVHKGGAKFHKDCTEPFFVKL